MEQIKKFLHGKGFALVLNCRSVPVPINAPLVLSTRIAPSAP